MEELLLDSVEEQRERVEHSPLEQFLSAKNGSKVEPELTLEDFIS